MFKAIKFYEELIRCSECRNFRPMPNSDYGTCQKRAFYGAVVKTTDYCSYAVPKSPPLEYDDHDVSGLIDE